MFTKVFQNFLKPLPEVAHDAGELVEADLCVLLVAFPEVLSLLGCGEPPLAADAVSQVGLIGMLTVTVGSHRQQQVTGATETALFGAPAPFHAIVEVHVHHPVPSGKKLRLSSLSNQAGQDSPNPRVGGMFYADKARLRKLPKQVNHEPTQAIGAINPCLILVGKD